MRKEVLALLTTLQGLEDSAAAAGADPGPEQQGPAAQREEAAQSSALFYRWYALCVRARRVSCHCEMS